MTKELVISVIIVVVIIAGDIFTTKYTNKSIETATQSLSEIRKEMEKENNYQMKESKYVSKKNIGRALEEVSNDLIHIKEN